MAGSYDSEGQVEQDPRVVPFTDLIGTVRSGSFQELLGVRESDQIDFKGVAYNLDIVRDRRDLIADVGALANNRGGVLVLGVGTTAHQTARIEVASRILGVQIEHVDEIRYLDTIRAHVEPLVRDVTVEVVNSEPPGRRHCVGLIVVQPQYEQDKPFLVDRLISSDDGRVPHAYGWPERSGDATHWHPLARIQPLVAAGLRGVTPTPPAIDEIGLDVALAYEIAEMDERQPSLLIQLIPIPADQLVPDFFGGTFQALRQWHPLRGAGFGFDPRWHQPIPRGKGLPQVWLTSLLRGCSSRKGWSHAQEVPARVQA